MGSRVCVVLLRRAVSRTKEPVHRRRGIRDRHPVQCHVPRRSKCQTRTRLWATRVTGLFNLLCAVLRTLRLRVIFFLASAPRRIISSMSSGPSSPPPSPHLRIHSTQIFVRDLDRSLRFYLDQLGFHLAYDVKLQAGERLVAVAPPDGSAVLSLLAPKPDSLQYKLIGRSTQVVFITEDVVSKYKEWSLRGVRFNHTPRLRRIKFAPEARTA